PTTETITPTVGTSTPTRTATLTSTPTETATPTDVPDIPTSTVFPESTPEIVPGAEQIEQVDIRGLAEQIVNQIPEGAFNDLSEQIAQGSDFAEKVKDNLSELVGDLLGPYNAAGGAFFAVAAIIVSSAVKNRIYYQALSSEKSGQVRQSLKNLTTKVVDFISKTRNSRKM
ncbi:MAG: hypothetical protein N2558_04650, partial [Patescibacteria group bacterium]|nr:hypothetical protein [Patescibacteria group bacterium]